MLDAFDDYTDNNQENSQATLQKREQNLRHFSTWLRNERDVSTVQAISKGDIKQYISHLVDEGYAKNTIMSGYYGSVAAALNWAYREGEIDINPTDSYKRKEIKKIARKAESDERKKDQLGGKDYLTKAEVYELAENAPEPSARNELLIKLMFWTGVRVSELVGISIGDDGTIDGPNSDIDPEAPKITVYAPKTNKARVVSYPRSEINPLLRDWVNHGRLRYKHADRLNYLFIGHKGEFTKSGVEDVVSKAAENIGIQEVDRISQDGKEYHRVTPHLLRHSHAMYRHNVEGISLDDLKDHLGHDSIETTENFYAEATTERMIDTFGE